MKGTRRSRRWTSLLLSLASFGVTTEPLTGRVIWVTDGDTMAVLDESRQQHKIRVAGIDAPEKKMPFGQRSKENQSRLVFDKEVAVDWHKQDRYQRIVGKVMVADPKLFRGNVSENARCWHGADYRGTRLVVSEVRERAASGRSGTL